MQRSSPQFLRTSRKKGAISQFEGIEAESMAKAGDQYQELVATARRALYPIANVTVGECSECGRRFA
jgi:hypothetical protein